MTENYLALEWRKKPKRGLSVPRRAPASRFRPKVRRLRVSRLQVGFSVINSFLVRAPGLGDIALCDAGQLV